MLLFLLAGCTTPFIIIKDAQFDLEINSKINSNFLGIWSSDKGSYPEGYMAIYQDSTSNYCYREHGINELSFDPNSL